MSRFDKYMAVPFLENGRTFDGADCFGLYALVLATELGLAVPDPHVAFGSHGARAVVHAFAAAVARGDWIEVDAPQMFDAVRMLGFHTERGEARRSETHVGCYVGRGQVLHTELGTGPRIMSLADPEIAARRPNFVRPQILAGRADLAA